MKVHRVFVAFVAVSPDLVQQPEAGEDPSGQPGEMQKKVEFLGGGR